MSDNDQILEQLTALLPVIFCKFKRGEIISHCTRSVLIDILRDALEKNYTVDRTNEDGSLDNWDGWIVVHAETPIFIQTNYKVRQG